MTLYEFRNNKEKLNMADGLLSTPAMQEMLAVVYASGPLFLQARNLPYGASVTPTDHSRMLGLIEGFQLALDYLESLGKALPAPPSEIMPTFESTENKRYERRKRLPTNPTR